MTDTPSGGMEGADTATAEQNVATGASTRDNNSESTGTIEVPKTPIQQRLLNDGSPIPIVVTTTTPKAQQGDTANDTHSPPQGKNYRVLYKEVTKRLFEQTENGKRRYLELEAEYNEMKEKYDHDRANYEASISNYTKMLSEKDNKIAELEEKLANGKTCVPLKRISSEDELVRLKPKRTNTKKPTANDDQHKCEFAECGQKDVDLTKCTSCGKWVCETWNDISASKLKQITNKCKRVYFLCKTCEEDVGSPCTASTKDKTLGDSNLVASLQKMFEKKVTQLESKIEKAIDKKLGEKMEAVTSLNEKIEKQTDANADKESYSKILQVPTEVKKAIQEAKNDEKVELSEQEKRSQNFIIHGAEEIGDTAEVVTRNDADYIKDILKKLGVQEKPESITRLGKPNDTKGRVLKICMKTKTGKESVMSNLSKLKGTEEEFGKISVTEDYTKTEREEIRKFTAKAREQQQNDSTRVYKVRGDPKNGLRVISYKK